MSLWETPFVSLGFGVGLFGFFFHLNVFIFL